MARPIGSYGDPVNRLRSWTVAAVIAKSCGAIDSKNWRALCNGHPCVAGIIRPDIFNAVVDDGAALERVPISEGWSLRDHLQGQPEAAGGLAAYNHPLWERLQPNAEPWSEVEAWLDPRLEAFGLWRIQPGDDGLATSLGLLDADQACSVGNLALDLSAERFASLDGLLLLHALQVLAWRERDLIHHAYFGDVLSEAAMQWAKTLPWSQEAQNTWEVLVATKLAVPHHQEHFKPVVKDDDSILAKIEVKQSNRDKTIAQWRRREHFNLWASQYRRVHGDAGIRHADSVWKWIASEREELTTKLDVATEALIDGDFPDAIQSPMAMPAELLRRRTRIYPDEGEWLVFGYHLPGDCLSFVPIYDSRDPRRPRRKNYPKPYWSVRYPTHTSTRYQQRERGDRELFDLPSLTGSAVR